MAPSIQPEVAVNEKIPDSKDESRTSVKQKAEAVNTEGSNQSYLHTVDSDKESGTEEEQAAFKEELKSFFREKSMEFANPKFYGEELNCLKLWRVVTRLGGYDRVTACNLWRKVGLSFKPPKTCTTISWSFRLFYEKALLNYERHKIRGDELPIPVTPLTNPLSGKTQVAAVISYSVSTDRSNESFPAASDMVGGDDLGSEEEQAAFTKELENFFKERRMEFKHPKFYGEELNCLKLWKVVRRLGGYDQVTACKLWRQVAKPFKPPKTCTSVSSSFRVYYEKALLDYERHTMCGVEVNIPASILPEPMSVETQMSGHQGPGSGWARRAAMHSQHLPWNGEVGDPISKDKNSVSEPKHEKQIKGFGLHKRKKLSNLDVSANAAPTITEVTKPQIDADVDDDADWVKIYVRKSKLVHGAQQYIDVGVLEDQLRDHEEALKVAEDRLARLKFEVEAREKEIEYLKRSKDEAVKAVAEAREHLKSLDFLVLEE